MIVWDVTVRRSVQPQVVAVIPPTASHEAGQGEILTLAVSTGAVAEGQRCFFSGGNDCIVRVRGMRTLTW